MPTAHETYPKPASRRRSGRGPVLALMLLASAAVCRGADDLSGTNVFPNPIRLYDSASPTQMTFDRLTPQAEIKIYDIDGGLVRDVQVNNPAGRFLWDLTDDSGLRVASGIYIYVISNDAGGQKTGKLAIIR